MSSPAPLRLPELSRPEPRSRRPARPLLSGGRALLTLLLFALAGAAGANPVEAEDGRRVGGNVRMNAPQPAREELLPGRAAEAIAASADGRRLVAAWDDLEGFCGAPFGKDCPAAETPGLTGVAYSTDGGETWVDMGAPPAIDGAPGDGVVITGGHPWLDRGGPDGEDFYLVSRARRPEAKEAGTALGVVGQVGITFHRGRFVDGKFEWRHGTLLAPSTERDVWRSPSVAAAKDGSGRVYVGLANLRGVCGLAGRSAGQIELLASADGGDTWAEPVMVSPDAMPTTEDPSHRLCGLVGALQIAPTVALGPDEAVYVVWPFGPFFFTPDLRNTSTTLGVRVAISKDGGKTFGYPRDAAYPHTLRHVPPVGFSKDGLNDFFQAAVVDGGEHRGRLVITYASAAAPGGTDRSGEQVLTSTQVYAVHTDDGGKTWSEPAALAPEVPAEGVKRLWPSVAARPGSAVVDVIYAESREETGEADCETQLLSKRVRKGPARSRVDVYWVQSVDGGTTFGPPLRVTSETSDWCSVTYGTPSILFSNFGDYLGIHAAGDRSFAVWTDGRGGVPDAYFAPLIGAPRIGAASTAEESP